MQVSRQAVIQSHLEALMQEILGVDELYVDDRGHVPVSTEVAGYTVRLCPSCDTPHIEVFSVAIEDVPADPGLYEALNDINRGLSHARIFWVDDRVIVAGELLGESADSRGLHCLCDEVARVADHHGPRLAETFGGTTGGEDE